MFELDKYDAKRRKTQIVLCEAPSPTPIAIEKMSLLAWGEHCIECAVPHCYSSCDLYDPRFDLRCRRFEYGIFQNKGFSSPHGYGAEISFKTWGKLETRGNTRLMPVWQVRSIESLLHRLSQLGNAVGWAVGNLLKDIRFNYVSYAIIEKLIRWQHRKNSSREQPSGFLIEIYNPTRETVFLKLSMRIERAFVPSKIPISQLPKPFSEKLSVNPGHFRKLVPWETLGEVVESELAFDISLTPEETTDLQLVFLTLDFVKLSKSSRERYQKDTLSSSKKPAVKCVVFDLDNTLWDGVILEEQDEVILRPGVKNLLDSLDRRGILMSIASKNAHDQAWRTLEKFGLTQYFLYPKINWQPKSKSIRQIAEDLNIGLNTFVFIDDNPAEISEVRSALSEIECFRDYEMEGLLDLDRLQGSSTSEASQRRKLYQEAAVREEVRGTFGDDYIGFLKSCDIRLEIQAFRDEYFDRTAELVQRTNQLNFSGHKYDREELRDIVDQPNLEKWVIACEDKFGAYGIVGFCIAQRDDEVLEIRDLMLSCRVQGKLIEQALFSHLAGTSTRTVCVQFNPTDRNAPAQQVLDAMGFQATDEGTLTLDLTEIQLTCDFIQVNSD